MAATMLRKGGHGKREESDCGPEHHGTILRLNGIRVDEAKGEATK